MSLSRALVFFAALAIVSARHRASAQDEFGQILLQAFTTGMFGGEQAPVPALDPTQTPSVAGAGIFPEVTLQPSPLQQSPEIPFESSESVADMSPEFSLEQSPEPSSVQEEEIDDTGIEESPESSQEPSLEPTFPPIPEASSESIPEVLAIVPRASNDTSADDFALEEEGAINGALTIFEPIRVNCGSFDNDGSFRADTEPWYNVESFVAADPFAVAQFPSDPVALLYSKYRSSIRSLLYTVPLETDGVWRVTLQWAEISPQYMTEGARVFTVLLNGDEVDEKVDVYKDSSTGSYSPLVRTYTLEATDAVASIEIVPEVGEPMLSAFQLTYLRPL